MEILSKRQGKILEELLAANQSYTTKELANKLDVSPKTVRNDIKEINEWLKDTYQAEIKSKPRVGVWLEIAKEDEDILKDELDFGVNSSVPNDKAERVMYIIKRLLETQQKLTMRELARELYVSRTTIMSDLEEVEKWLKKHNLRLKKKPNWGMKVVGKEKNWRSAVSHLLSSAAEIPDLLEFLSHLPTPRGSRKLYINNLNEIQAIIDQPDLPRIERVIRETQKEFNFQFTDQAYSGLVIHLAIALRRIKLGESVEVPHYDIDELKTRKEYEMAKKIVVKLENELGISIPQEEIAYITLHLLGAKVQETPNENQEFGISLGDIDPEIIKLAQDMILKAEEILDVTLRADSQLLVGLSVHLRSAVNRLKYNLNLFNPMLDRVKSSYSLTYEAAVEASKVIENEYGVEMVEDEIGYITIHLQAALERLENKRQIDVLIVCATGVGTAQLLAAKLKRLFSDFNIVKVASSFEVEEELLEELTPDLVITTIPLNFKKKIPILKVDPILSNSDIQRLEGFLGELDKETSNLDGNFSKVVNKLKSDLIFINKEFTSRKEVIEFLGNKLVENDYAESGFVNSVLAREKLSSTNIGNRVAIPHGFVEGVIKPGIVVCKLKEPISWGEEKSDLIFLLAMNLSVQEEVKVLFNQFYKLVQNKKILNKLRKVKTGEEFIKLLKGEGDK